MASNPFPSVGHKATLPFPALPPRFKSGLERRSVAAPHIQARAEKEGGVGSGSASGAQRQQ